MFDKLGIPREVFLFLEIKKIIIITFSKNSGICQVIKKGGNTDKCLPQSTFKQRLI